MQENQSSLKKRTVAIPLAMVLTMWTVFWLEMKLHTDFTSYGLLPRSFSGLIGVFTSPFIHSGISHLWSNTLPILLLSLALLYFYRPVALRVLLVGVLLTGLFTWSIGRNAYHIGASGIIYMLASFLFFKGVFTGYYRLIALSLLVIFLYGSLIWYLFPVDPTISWEGHASGAFSGLIIAIWLKAKVNNYDIIHSKNTPSSESDDWFMQQFDEDGNFNPIQLDEEE